MSPLRRDSSPPPSIPCAAVLTAWDSEQTIRSSGKRGTPRGPSNSGAGRARWGPTPDREIWGASGWRTTRYPSSCLRDRQLSSLKHLANSQRGWKSFLRPLWTALKHLCNHLMVMTFWTGKWIPDDLLAQLLLQCGFYFCVSVENLHKHWTACQEICVIRCCPPPHTWMLLHPNTPYPHPLP